MKKFTVLYKNNQPKGGKTNEKRKFHKARKRNIGGRNV